MVERPPLSSSATEKHSERSPSLKRSADDSLSSDRRSPSNSIKIDSSSRPSSTMLKEEDKNPEQLETSQGEFVAEFSLLPPPPSSPPIFEIPEIAAKEESDEQNVDPAASSVNDIESTFAHDTTMASPPPDISTSANPSAVRKETLAEKKERIRRLQAGTQQPSSSSSETPRTITYEPSFTKSTLVNLGLPAGATGLSNLGNTCFMNSALQCLSNAVPLTTYFLLGNWKEELNPENPLGMKGRVAQAYATLINNLWRVGEHRLSSYAPREFKQTIGHFNPMFLGYSQQDSEELLRFLLDGLHEDLNRIKQKPYTEVPDMDGQPEEVVAAKLWELYRLRNDSVIVDLFQGEYKSRVECLECGKWSVTFDPYMFLSVPIPDRREISINYTAVSKITLLESRESLTVIRDIIRVPKDATIQVLKKKVAEKMGWVEASNNLRRIQVVEIFNHKVYKLFESNNRVSDIRPSDTIYVVELGDPDPSLFQNSAESKDVFESAVHLPGYFLLESEETVYNYSTYKPSPQPFGVPLMVTLPQKITITIPENYLSIKEKKALAEKVRGQRIYRQLVRNLRRYSRLPLFRRVGTEITLTEIIDFIETNEKSNDSDLDNSSSSGNSNTLDSKLSRKDYKANELPFDVSDIDSGEEWEPLPDIFKLRLIQGSTTEKPMPSSTYYMYGSSSSPLEVFWNTGWQNCTSYQLYPNESALSSSKDSARKKEKQKMEVDKGTSDLDAALRLDDNDYDNEDYNTNGSSAANYGDNESYNFNDSSSVTSDTKIDSYEAMGLSVSDDEDEAKPSSETLAEHIGISVAAAHDFDSTLEDERLADDLIIDTEIKSIPTPPPLHPTLGSSKNDKTEPNPNWKDWKRQSDRTDDDGKIKNEINQSSEEEDYDTDEMINKELEKQIDNPELYTLSFDMRGEQLLIMDWCSRNASFILGVDVESRRFSREGDGEFLGVKSQDLVSQEEKKYSARNKADHNVTLMECINEYCKVETLGEEDTWYCPNCKTHQRIKKKLDIWSVPEVLVFHLKRFSNTGRISAFSRMTGDKIDCLVDFPIEGLDMTDSVIGPRERPSSKSSNGFASDDDKSSICKTDDKLIYDLFAVSNHFGGLGGGHYTAYAKNGVTGQWYNFDDSSVSKAQPDAVMTEAAYLLFYQRRSAAKPEILHHALQEVAKAGPPEPTPSTAYSPNIYRKGGYTLGGYGPMNREGASSSSTLATMGNTPKHSRPASPAESSDNEGYEVTTKTPQRFTSTGKAMRPDPAPSVGWGIASANPVVSSDFSYKLPDDDDLYGPSTPPPSYEMETASSPLSFPGLDDDNDTVMGTGSHSVKLRMRNSDVLMEEDDWNADPTNSIRRTPSPLLSQAFPSPTDSPERKTLSDEELEFQR